MHLLSTTVVQVPVWLFERAKQAADGLVLYIFLILLLKSQKTMRDTAKFIFGRYIISMRTNFCGVSYEPFMLPTVDICALR